MADSAQSIIAVDVNKDGVADVVCNDLVLLGNGTGGFQALPQLASLSGIAYTAADLNGDGTVDLVFSGAYYLNVNGPYGIGVSFGNGDGTFQPPMFYQAGTDKYFDSIVLADLNGDGIPDAATQGESGIWIFTGKGGGSFDAGVLLPATQLSYSSNILNAADVNGDGKIDLIASTSTGFAVLLGNGDGTFAPQIDTAVAFYTYESGITVADLNGDGHPDVIAVDNDTGYTYVLVYLGKGDGTFAPPIPASLPGFINVAVGDINGDHIPDLISDGVNIALGRGDGTFKAPQFFPVSDFADSVTLADLRNTGRLDIVADGTFGTVSVLFNQGHGAFEDGVWSPLQSGSAGCAASQDFNGDGHPDLAVRVNAGVSVQFGTGVAAKPFVQGELIPFANSNCVFTADFNGDGIADLLTLSLAPYPSTAAYLTTFLGRGDGKFTEKSVTTLPEYARVALGDFNGDGKVDFATSGNLLALGNGDGTFATPVAYIPFTPDPSGFSDIGTADLNGDGLADVVLTDDIFDNVYVLLNTGSGKFTETSFNTDYKLACLSPFMPVFGDLNGDGYPDLTLGCVDGNVPLYLNDGTGHFTYSKSLVETAVSDFMQPIIADLNGDGIPDIAVLTDFDIAVFFGKGGLNYTAPIYLGTGTLPAYMLEMNLHGQTPHGGTPDLVVPDSAQGAVLSILNLTK